MEKIREAFRKSDGQWHTLAELGVSGQGSGPQALALSRMGFLLRQKPLAGPALYRLAKLPPPEEGPRVDNAAERGELIKAAALLSGATVAEFVAEAAEARARGLFNSVRTMLADLKPRSGK